MTWTLRVARPRATDQSTRDLRVEIVANSRHQRHFGPDDRQVDVGLRERIGSIARKSSTSIGDVFAPSVRAQCRDCPVQRRRFVTRALCATFHASACSRPPSTNDQDLHRQTPSVAKMPQTRKHHRQTVFVGRGDHFVVAHRTTRLNHRRDAGGRRRVDPVAKRKKRIRRHHRSRAPSSPSSAAFIAGDPGAHDATHLARADADGRAGSWRTRSRSI